MSRSVNTMFSTKKIWFCFGFFYDYRNIIVYFFHVIPKEISYAFKIIMMQMNNKNKTSKVFFKTDTFNIKK